MIWLRVCSTIPLLCLSQFTRLINYTEVKSHFFQTRIPRGVPVVIQPYLKIAEINAPVKMENVSLLSIKLCVITHFFTGIWLFSSSTKQLYYPNLFTVIKYRVGLNNFRTGQCLRFPWTVTKKVTNFLDAVLHSRVDYFFYPEDGHSRFLWHVGKFLLEYKTSYCRRQ